MTNNRYPNLQIRSKNELAKRLSGKGFSKTEALNLINDVLANYEQYWSDHPTMSQPDKNKWVRNAKRTNLGLLLKLINQRILKPYDDLIPNFIFGGVGGLDHKAAVRHLLGKRHKRLLLKIDITSFFEQIHDVRVYHFFMNKAGCSSKAAYLLANVCCVYCGPKINPGSYKTVGRGFSTSTRLAVWCNIDTFIKLEHLVNKELRDKDPKIAIFVDDIGITASDITKEDLTRLYLKIKAVLEADINQKLPLNKDKLKIIYHSGDTYSIDGKYQGKWCFEHLGIQMNRNHLTLGTKSRQKLRNVTQEYKATKGRDITLKNKRKSSIIYRSYIEK